jgi:hypothetical protein
MGTNIQVYPDFSLLEYLATDRRLLNEDFNYNFSRFVRRFEHWKKNL